MDCKYPFFIQKNIDWDSIFVAYKERAQSSEAGELEIVFQEVVDYLRDGHCCINTTNVPTVLNKFSISLVMVRWILFVKITGIQNLSLSHHLQTFICSRFCQRTISRLYSTSHSQCQRFRVRTGFSRGQSPTVGHRDCVYVFVARTVARVVVDGTRACKLRQRHKPLFAVSEGD